MSSNPDSNHQDSNTLQHPTYRRDQRIRIETQVTLVTIRTFVECKEANRLINLRAGYLLAALTSFPMLELRGNGNLENTGNICQDYAD